MRLSFPKKREDIEKVVEEVEARHEHEEHHHHHHGVEDAITALQMLVEALNSRVSSLESKLTSQGLEVAKLYKVLAHLVEALMADSEEAKRRSLLNAIKALEEDRRGVEL